MLQHFPYDTPRPSQEAVMRQLVDGWFKYDVSVINAPVAFGKTPLAMFCMNYANHRGQTASWIVPNNALVAQGHDEFHLPILGLKKTYENTKAYNTARDIFKDAPMKVMNPFTLLAHRCYSDVQIFDECHTLLAHLQDMEGIKFWQHIHNFPEGMRTVTDVLMWLCSIAKWNKSAEKMLQKLQAHPDTYVIAYEWEMYRNKVARCLRVYPLTPKNNRPILWPPYRVKKLVLMSATVSRKDIEELGLGNYRVQYIEAESDIPPANRPLALDCLGSMGGRHGNQTLGEVSKYLVDKLDNTPHRGFIHATYNTSSKLRTTLGGHPRLRMHTKHDKSDKFKDWLHGGKDTVFMGSGLTEGINLKDDLCRWQVITKCPFANLGEPAIAAKAKADEQWYAWNTIREILQAYGRVCRGPNDYGITHIVDSDFLRLYSRWPDLWPKWFKQAMETF